MKQIRNRTANIILLAALAFGLIGCGQSANIEEELPEEERPEPRLIYQTKTAEIAAGNEAVLFQQGCAGQYHLTQHQAVNRLDFYQRIFLHF